MRYLKQALSFPDQADIPRLGDSPTPTFPAASWVSPSTGWIHRYGSDRQRQTPYRSASILLAK